VHDNKGLRDEHLWPGDGAIDFQEVDALIKPLSTQLSGVLEIAYDLGHDEAEIKRRTERATGIMREL
jgi:sugar phosphate isomerase/epimerase